MAKRMLIDAAHPEETRVVVLSGNRLEEFDFESSTKKQVKGNIYLAKVTRVEPSLQAAFVDYGGGRHGFLAFSEIHPDYFKIPVADRDASEIAAGPRDEVEIHELASESVDGVGVSLAAALPEPVPVSALAEAGEEETAEGESFEQSPEVAPAATEPVSAMQEHHGHPGDADPRPISGVLPWEEVALVSEPTPIDALPLEIPAAAPEAAPAHFAEALIGSDASIAMSGGFAPVRSDADALAADDAIGATAEARADGNGDGGEGEGVETIGGDELEEAEHQRLRAIRHYKIQEVIKRRQIMLVQVSKEERGTKGAALTTYLSLAGRYCVLMPNTGRGGGVSRKITSISDRRRLKEVLEELDIPEGMGVIVRTAGAERSKAEIKRDYEYLLRLWNEIRDLTLRSTAPALIYEEGNLIKRSIRDLYTRDMDEVLVEGEDGYRTAKAFMKMLMPSHARRVQPYRDPQIGLFHRFQVESQIDAIHSPIVQLRSGGYVVINQAEALVAIDVNSGRSTRERNIEETAVRTNLEAAEEIARQLRLRDLAGLIVIDFIDMEEHRNQGAVERRLKDALKSDRARIQVGRISPFGLLEMSRQRLRPSLVETSTQPCPHCGGTGFIRSTESTALYVLRSIEEEGMRRRSAEVCVYVPTAVALYILNQKRESLVQLEARYGIRVLVAQDDALIPPAFRLERLRAFGYGEEAAVPTTPLTQAPTIEEEEEEEEIEEVAEPVEAERHELQSDEERNRRRRRRRRRRAGEEIEARLIAPSSESVEETDEGEEAEEEGEHFADKGRSAGEEGESEAERRRRRRGRRGGRRRLRRDGASEPVFEAPRPPSDTVEILPTSAIEEQEPTPAEAQGGGCVEIGQEVGAELAAAAIETANVPVLAGELPGVHEGSAAAGENEWPTPERVDISGEAAVSETPHPQPVAETVELETTPAPSPTAETEPGVPFLSLTEQREETAAPQPRLEPETAAEVQTVSQKQPNPRRGWWQRLIQS